MRQEIGIIPKSYVFSNSNESKSEDSKETSRSVDWYRYEIGSIVRRYFLVVQLNYVFYQLQAFNQTFIEGNAHIEQKVMQTIYWVMLLTGFISLILNYMFEHKTCFLFLAQAISIYRTIIRTFDFEKS